MFHGDAVGLFVGAVALGAVHGVEPGHGWPIAAAYALDQTNKWGYGLAASVILGVGHLVSSITMVGVFFYAKSYFDLARVDEPITLLGGVQVGGPVSLVAGVVLVALGVREYRRGHSHGTATGGHDPTHADADGSGNDPHTDDHDHSPEHSHDHPHTGGHDGPREAGGRARGHADLAAADRGLAGIAWSAFLLGVAHEEEFEVIALCAGSTRCLELMAAYALTVIAGIVSLTLLLVAGYERYETRVEQLRPYLPTASAAVLAGMGLGFVLGLF